MKRRDAITIIVLFLLTIGGVLPLGAVWNSLGGPQSAAALSHSTRPPSLDWESVRVGRFAREWDEFLVDDSWLSRVTAPWYRWFGFAMLDRTTPHVRIGEDGWLFLTDHVRARSDAWYEAQTHEAVRRLREVHDACRAYGVRLHVALVPDRWRVAPDAIDGPDGVPTGGRATQLNALLVGLQEEGVSVTQFLVPLKALEDAGIHAFYRDDHHWTSSGARVSMEVLAPWLRRRFRLPWGCFHPGAPGLVDENCVDPTRWQRPMPLEPSPSSIWRKLGLPSGPVGERWRDPQPRVEPVETDPQGDSQIAYVASSFGRFGSPQFLAAALGLPIDAHVSVGRGSMHGMSAFLARYPDGDRRTRLVVWEIPEYHLRAKPGEALPWSGLAFPPVAPAEWIPIAARLDPAASSRTAPLDSESNSASDATLARWLGRGGPIEWTIELDEPVTTIALDLRGSGLERAATITAVGAQRPTRPWIDDGEPIPYWFEFETPRTRITVRVDPVSRGGAVEWLGTRRAIRESSTEE